MRQQINLYLTEFKVKKDALTVVLMLQVLGIAVGVMMLVGAYDVFTRYRLNTELTELRGQLIEETRKTDLLDDELARRAQNDDLAQRLNLAEARLESSRQIRDFFSRAQLGNVNGFSEYFKDLSRAWMEGFELSQFQFNNGGESVNLRGFVQRTALLPQYIINIGRGRSELSNRRFSYAFERSEENPELFAFVLSTSNE